MYYTYIWYLCALFEQTNHEFTKNCNTILKRFLRRMWRWRDWNDGGLAGCWYRLICFYLIFFLVVEKWCQNLSLQWLPDYHIKIYIVLVIQNNNNTYFSLPSIITSSFSASTENVCFVFAVKIPLLSKFQFFQY